MCNRTVKLIVDPVDWAVVCKNLIDWKKTNKKTHYFLLKIERWGEAREENWKLCAFSSFSFEMWNFSWESVNFSSTFHSFFLPSVDFLNANTIGARMSPSRLYCYIHWEKSVKCEMRRMGIETNERRREMEEVNYIQFVVFRYLPKWIWYTWNNNTMLLELCYICVRWGDSQNFCRIENWDGIGKEAATTHHR